MKMFGFWKEKKSRFSLNTKNPPRTTRGCGWLFLNTPRSSCWLLFSRKHSDTHTRTHVNTTPKTKLKPGCSNRTELCCHIPSWRAGMYLLLTAAGATSASRGPLSPQLPPQTEQTRSPTYIWYSSIASTNCPHESKSEPFLKLACHFWIVLFTSDILSGGIVRRRSQDSISEEGGSSAGLQRRPVCQPVQSRGSRTNRWHPDQALSAWPTLMWHPRAKGSPARSLRCAWFAARGRPEERRVLYQQ